MTENATVQGPLKPHWYQILLSLADRDLHGQGIMHDVLERTENGTRLWPAMLYGALKRMMATGLVEMVDHPDATDRRRFYRITQEGRRVLAEDTRRLVRYVEAARAKRVLEESA